MAFPTVELEGALKGLRNAWRRGGLVPFVGAGASQAYGLPGWRSLVLELMYESTRSELFEGHTTPYQRALSSWLADYCAFDLTVLASAVREQVGSESERRTTFARKLRELLYALYKPPASSEPTILRSIAQLARQGELATIITFNFDDLLEEELRAAGVQHYSVWNGNWGEGRGVPVIHAHGFLPREGPLDPDSIVFAEDDYHDLSQQLFHWSQVEIIQSLRKHTALFVGLSMTDPNLRRLLDLGRREQRQAHWVIQKRRELPPAAKLFDVLADIQRRATEFGADGATAVKPSQIEDALPQALVLANDFDQRLLVRMAVKTIWVDRHSEIPSLIDLIARGHERRAAAPNARAASFATTPPARAESAVPAPGAAPPPPPAPAPPARAAVTIPVDPADPQKGLWGGRSERNGRKVAATVANQGKSWFSIELWVAASAGAPPLEGDVTFHLHPTFPKQVMTARAKDGHARLRLEAYGAFTVGVVADGGATKLELDLASDEVEAPPEFKLS